MVAKWSGVLSTTEPRNDIGVLNVRQGNINSETAEFMIIQNNKPYNLTGLKVDFCANFGLSAVQKSAVVKDAVNGKIEFIFNDPTMQAVGRKLGYFQISKDGSLIDSTQDFEYRIQDSILSRKMQGGSYIESFENILETLGDNAAVGLANDINRLEDKTTAQFQQTTAQLAQTKTETTAQLAQKVGGEKKAELENLSSNVLAAIEGGDGTTFSVLSEPQNSSVNPEKLELSLRNSLYDVSTKNLYNPYKAKSGLINSLNEEVPSSVSVHTEKIPVTAGETIFFSSNGAEAQTRYVTPLKEDGTPLATTDSQFVWLRNYKIPSGVTHVIVSFDPTTNPNFFISRLHIGITSYEPYYLPKTDKLESKVSALESNGIDGFTLNNLITRTSQLIDYSKLSEGYVNGDGTIMSSENLYYSELISVVEGDVIHFSNDGTPTQARFVSEYGNNKTFIKNNDFIAVYTVPHGVYSVSITFNKTTYPKFQAEFDSVTPFNKALYAVGEENLDGKVKSKIETTIDLVDFNQFIFYCAVGRTIEIYNKAVCLQADEYHIKWDCSVGIAYNRKFQIKGISDLIGEYPLSFSVYDDKLNLIATTTTTLKIVAETTLSKSVVWIGDSLSAGVIHQNEIETLSSGRITSIGSIQKSSGEYNEGRSGFSAQNYIWGTPFNYNGVVESPHNNFYNPTTKRFDWNYYKETQEVSPEIVQLWLGTNGIQYYREQVNSIKQMIDYIRQDDSSIPIYIVDTIYRASQSAIGRQGNVEGYSASQGQYKYEEDKKTFNLIEHLNDTVSEYTNLHIIPLALVHDSEHNYGAMSLPVNPRANQTESVPVDSVHPQEQGYLQVADYIYSVYSGTFA